MVTRACLRYAREGQNVTQAGPKCHTSRAKMSHKGQNVTQSCYNVWPWQVSLTLTFQWGGSTWRVPEPLTDASMQTDLKWQTNCTLRRTGQWHNSSVLLFLPEASIDLWVLSLPASVRLSVSPSVCHQVCPRDNSSPVQARITKVGP